MVEQYRSVRFVGIQESFKVQALQQKFTTLEVGDPLNPVVMSEKKGFSVIVTVRLAPQSCQSTSSPGLFETRFPFAVNKIILFLPNRKSF